MPEGMITVVGNGTACVVGGHGYTIKKECVLLKILEWLLWVMICLQL